MNIINNIYYDRVVIVLVLQQEVQSFAGSILALSHKAPK